MTQHESETDQRVVGFEEKVARQCRTIGLVDTSVLLAVSGGADSLAMLRGLTRLQARLSLRVEVATVDHGLRPESAADAAFVVSAAEKVGLKARVLQLALAPGSGVESRARDARYEVLQAHQRRVGLRFLATAHTASDQAETVVFRLARGASLAGVGGVQPARADGVVRPLLTVQRAEVEGYLGALDSTWRHDAMNDDRRFARVRLRSEVLPALEQVVPGAAFALARFAALAADDERYLADEAAVALGRVGWPDGSLELVACRALASPIRRRVLATFVAGHGVEVSARLIDEGVRAIEQAGTATLTDDLLLTCRGGRVRVEAAPARLHATSPSEGGRSEQSGL